MLVATLGIGAAALLVADGLKTVEQYSSVYRQNLYRNELIQAYKANGVTQALLPSMRVPYILGLNDDVVEKRFFLRDIHPDIPGNGWRNGSYADDHGLSFALRAHAAYVLYEPLLSSEGRFSTVYSRGSERLVETADPIRYGRRAAFWIDERGACDPQSSPGPEWSDFEGWRRGEAVFVDASGQLRTDICVLYGQRSKGT